MSNNYELKKFCKNIKSLRQENGLSEKAMSKKLNIGIITLMLLEKGIVPKWLSVEILIHIHYHFGIRPSEMFEDRE